MLDSVRVRLTLWYLGVLGVILIVFSLAIYIFVERGLYERLDADLYSTLNRLSAALKHQASDGESRSKVAIQAVQEPQPPSQAIAIFDARGSLLADREATGGVRVRLPSSGIAALTDASFYSLPEQTSESDDSCRGIVGRVQLQTGDVLYTIVVNESLEPVTEHLELLRDIFSIAIPVALLLAGLGGWLLARRSLQPVADMSARAQRISAENLGERLPMCNPRDELGRLSATFNELLERLANSFSQQRQFMADASHELRTPLSVIRIASAVSLERQEREQREYREALAIIEQQARRLSRIVEDMFILARADAGHPSLQITKFYLDELVIETTRDASVLASRKHIQVSLPSMPEAPFEGDEGLLRQMMGNLFGNAIKYTPDGGAVRVAMAVRDAEYVVTVADTGTGVPAETQAHIFERFYRADKARSPRGEVSEGGAGLGLPIARWIAEIHGGRLDLQSSSETGSTFVVVLPHCGLSTTHVQA
jgi:two-component system, OmpR family, sensor kinase